MAETKTNYGITWADEYDTLFQTGYNYPTIEGAMADAEIVLRWGSMAITPKPDEMCVDGILRKPLYAYVETEYDTVLRLSLDRGVYADYRKKASS